MEKGSRWHNDIARDEGPLRIVPHERDELSDAYIPRYIFNMYGISDFKETQPLRGIAMIAYPKPNLDKPVLTIVKHSELFKPQQALKEFNSIKALLLVESDYVVQLLQVYCDPDTDSSDGGAYLETFYSIQLGDWTNTLYTELMRQSIFWVEDVYDIIYQVLCGAHAARQVGIFHGAICATNILVERTQKLIHIKLYNFGQLAENQSPNEIAEPYVRSPEYIAKFTPLSSKTDSWNIGLLTVQLLTYRVPFKTLNDLHVLEEMVKYCGYNSKTDMFKDKFMKGLLSKAGPQLDVARLETYIGDLVRRNMNKKTGKEENVKEEKLYEKLKSLVTEVAFIHPDHRSSVTKLLNDHFHEKLDGPLVEPTAERDKYYNERDYYNFDGDMDEIDEETEKWAARIYKIIKESKAFKITEETAPAVSSSSQSSKPQ